MFDVLHVVHATKGYQQPKVEPPGLIGCSNSLEPVPKGLNNRRVGDSELGVEACFGET